MDLGGCRSVHTTPPPPGHPSTEPSITPSSSHKGGAWATSRRLEREELGTPGATPIGQVRAAEPLSPCSPPSLPPSQRHNDLRRPQPPGLSQVTDGASSSVWAFVLPQWWGKWEALGSGMRSRPPTHQLQDPGPGWPP